MVSEQLSGITNSVVILQDFVLYSCNLPRCLNLIDELLYAPFRVHTAGRYVCDIVMQVA